MFRVGERDDALQKLQAVKNALPTVASLLEELTPQLNRLQAELKAIEESFTLKGLLYDSPCPRMRCQQGRVTAGIGPGGNNSPIMRAGCE